MVELSPSPDLTDDQQTLYGSWVTSLPDIEDLMDGRPTGMDAIVFDR